MGKRVRISDSTLNAYGTRVLTEGVDLEQYTKNPILLWMHNRAWRGTKEEVLPLGYVKDIRVEGDEITGEPVIDTDDEFAKQIASKWEKGILRMVSPNFDIIAVDESPDLALPGQTRATITKSKLIEVSIVDIGGNDNNIQLNYEGKELKLSEGGECPDIPMINISDKKPNKKEKKMFELKDLSLKLGLPESATQEEALRNVDLLLGYKSANASLQKELEELKLAAVTSKIDEAIASGKVPAAKKNELLELGKTNPQGLELALSLAQKPVKATDVIGDGANGPTSDIGSLELSKYKKLSDVPEDKIMEIRENHKEEYIRLFKAEYGYSCKI